jgi:tRNA pseudouridine38-40 synthase
LIDPRADREPQQRLKLVVAYDGRGFSGSQRQPGKRTVQGELEAAASKLFDTAASMSLAGRTDSGVHAVGQVASCLDFRPGLSEWQIARALRAHLAEDLSVGSVDRVSISFDPRRDARWRQYRYQIWNGPPNPLVRGRTALVERSLDVDAIRQVATALVGEQDFASFAGLGQGVPWTDRTGRGTVRRIWAVGVESCPGPLGRMVTVSITGDAFLPGQVRSMIGALIEIGRGRRDSDWLAEVIATRDRRVGPKSAPAHGLVLWQVGYEPYTGSSGSTGRSGVESTGIDRDGS